MNINWTQYALHEREQYRINSARYAIQLKEISNRKVAHAMYRKEYAMYEPRFRVSALVARMLHRVFGAETRGAR